MVVLGCVLGCVLGWLYLDVYLDIVYLDVGQGWILYMVHWTGKVEDRQGVAIGGGQVKGLLESGRMEMEMEMEMED
jgi:hypothetical protein